MNDFHVRCVDLHRPEYVPIICYCDDLMLISPNHKHMEELLEVLDRYATRWKVEFNSKKSVSIRFDPRFCGDVVFIIGGHPIPQEMSFTYLGFRLARSMKSIAFLMRR